MDDHPGLHSVVRESLYDRKIIRRPLAKPHLSLSNNAAEQAPRHWVISRTIIHEARSEAGFRALSLLAGVIETCRRRGASVWRYLATAFVLPHGFATPRAPRHPGGSIGE